MELVRRLQHDITALDELSTPDLEQLVTEILIDRGWQIAPSTAGGEYAGDMLARHACALGVTARWIIECKALPARRSVSEETVVDLQRVASLLGGTNALLVTTSHLGQNAAQIVQDFHGVEVVDRTRLIDWVNSYPRRIVRETSFSPSTFVSCFLSYSKHDLPFASELHARLTREGVEVWFAEKNLNPGEAIDDQVWRAIAAVEKLIVVLSDKSLESPWVRAELRRAHKRELHEKRQIIFPVRLVPFDRLNEWRDFYFETATDIAEEVRRIYIPDFSGWRNPSVFDDGMARLIEALRRLPA